MIRNEAVTNRWRERKTETLSLKEKQTKISRTSFQDVSYGPK